VLSSELRPKVGQLPQRLMEQNDVDADVKDDELYLILRHCLKASVGSEQSTEMTTSVGKRRSSASPQFWSLYWRQYK
jgi:hypothetical protein